MPTLLYHDAITQFSRKQFWHAQSYTRLATYSIVAYITLTIRFVLKKTYVACLLLQMRRTFQSQTYTIVAYITLTMCFLRSQENLDNNIHPYTYITMHSLNHKNGCQSCYTNNILLRSRKNL